MNYLIRIGGFLFLVFIMNMTLVACHQSGPQNAKNVGCTIDTSKIAIIPYDTSDHWYFKDCKPTSLSSKDIRDAEKILNECVINSNKVSKRFIEKNHPELSSHVNEYLINLNEYKRQYIPVINSKGETEICINCICEQRAKNSGWKMNPIIVEDGGKCFFHVKVNLTLGKYYGFCANGEA